MITVDTLILRVNQFILNPLIALAFAVAFFVFFWGIVQFIRDADSSEGRDKGRQNILYGIIGMVIMVSAFGIIRLTLNSFGISSAPVDNIQGQ